MKIVNIVPGFGGTFYCGNCLRDSVFAKTLKTTGHEVVVLPIYLPLAADNPTELTDSPVFYGAVNIYLKQNFSFFRHAPNWLHRFFDSKPMLRYAAKKAGSTRADGLEEMTISMLQGADGFQYDELQELINYLKHHEKPDLVHLSNALLLGLAKKIKEELNIPVVCSLQDEDVWVDAMKPDYLEKLWKLMAEKANDVDAFIAVSSYFAELMQKKMSILKEKMHVVHIGVDPNNYTVHKPNTKKPVIGYLSRLCSENGFEILIDAFIKLKDTSSHKNAQLKVTGGSTGDDKKFIQKQIKKLKQKGYLNDVTFVADFRAEKLSAFFSDLTLMSVPVLNGEAFGLYLLEALASGIPILQPALGAFPEVAKLTGGGIIYEPNSPQALAIALDHALSDTENLHKLSVKGRNAIENQFNTVNITHQMLDVYTKVVSLK